jgi:hypothetical protein
VPTRAESLADQFEAVTNEAIREIQNCSDAKWKSTTPNDGRTVNVVAHHIASGDRPISELVAAIAYGKPMPPITLEMIDQGNAQHAIQFANVTKDETIALLRQNSAPAASAVRGMTDEQLDKTGDLFGNAWTAEEAIQRILIGHVQGHLESIRAAG